MPAQPKPKFNDNEKVLCFHGPLLYEAKCVKNKRNNNSSNNQSGEPKSDFLYWVHYQGWNKNWDEWVPENRILKINPENLERKSKLLKEHIATTSVGSSKKKSGKSGKSSVGGSVLGSGNSGSGMGGSTPSMDGSSKRSDSASNSRASTPVSERSMKVGGKRSLGDDEQSNSSREGENTPLSTPNTSSSKRKKAKQEQTPDNQEVKPEADEVCKFQIRLPEDLKFVLVSDWDLVSNKKKLFQLPAKTSAASILADFTKTVEKSQKAKTFLSAEVTKGIRDFFNEVVKTELLYSMEKNQFEEIVEANPSKTPIEIYGSAHLLRLMVKMNSLLGQTTLCTKNDVVLLEGVISDLLDYLENNQGKYFTSKNYSDASEEYLKALQE